MQRDSDSLGTASTAIQSQAFHSQAKFLIIRGIRPNLCELKVKTAAGEWERKAHSAAVADRPRSIFGRTQIGAAPAVRTQLLRPHPPCSHKSVLTESRIHE